MPQLIKRRIVPLLLLFVLCIGMVPTAFADAEITVTDNAASGPTTQEDSQHNADIVAVSYTHLDVYKRQIHGFAAIPYSIAHGLHQQYKQHKTDEVLKAVIRCV